MAKSQTSTTTAEPTETEFKRRLCGCSQIVNPRSRFLPGHDQRLRGIKLREFDAGSEQAGLDLIELGWETNDSLQERAAKQERVAEKAQAKAQRDEKARLNAEAKAAAKAEKVTRKADTTTVEPVAKPKRETQSSRTTAAGRRLASEQQAQTATA